MVVFSFQELLQKKQKFRQFDNDIYSYSANTRCTLNQKIMYCYLEFCALKILLMWVTK